MKRFMIATLGGFLMACSGAESGLLDTPTNTTQSASADDAASEAAVVTLPEFDASAEDAGVCVGYADPSTEASCHACTGGSCQTNGCFGGYYCKLDTSKCVPQPDVCP